MSSVANAYLSGAIVLAAAALLGHPDHECPRIPRRFLPRKKLYLPLPGILCYRRGLNGGADKRATLVELNIEYKLLQSPYYRSAYLSSETEVT